MPPVGEILRVAFCSGKTITELSFGKFLNCAFDNSNLIFTFYKYIPLIYRYKSVIKHSKILIIL